MKWMRMVAVVMVTAALALGAAGCAKKTEDAPAEDAAAQGGMQQGILKSLEENKPADPAPAN